MPIAPSSAPRARARARTRTRPCARACACACGQQYLHGTPTLLCYQGIICGLAGSIAINTGNNLQSLGMHKLELLAIKQAADNGIKVSDAPEIAPYVIHSSCSLLLSPLPLAPGHPSSLLRWLRHPA